MFVSMLILMKARNEVLILLRFLFFLTVPKHFNMNTSFIQFFILPCDVSYFTMTKKRIQVTEQWYNSTVLFIPQCNVFSFRTMKSTIEVNQCWYYSTYFSSSLKETISRQVWKTGYININIDCFCKPIEDVCEDYIVQWHCFCNNKD